MAHGWQHSPPHVFVHCNPLSDGCEAQGGVFLGPEVTCDGYDCSLRACCRPRGLCDMTPQAHCEETLGGMWMAEDSICGDFNQNGADDVCESIGSCRSDINGDDVVGFLDLVTLLTDWGTCR